MKSLVCWLLLWTSLGYAGELTAAGEWSAPVKGLRGRLCFAEGKLFDGTRIARVYLELQYSDDPGGRITVDFGPPQLEVVDSAGKIVPQVQNDEYMCGGPEALLLPAEATIRLRISLGHWPAWTWVIPKEKGDDRFLIGSFTVPERKRATDFAMEIEAQRKELARGNVWHGTLNLPKLKLPTDPGESSSK